ncbi:hypothetical protein [Novosphingobium album (ex Hu et al. 2023)]|uniref:Uncharacterized protein n=1 Tax=Novosphingobium album (ex Hu et al. 2023) TaxID=2930093 RepID=A0ABT0B093_9SPHN|nr:hypothetical protein [Novosphingobium album (ex Hu et al. 2023)]MCJ2178472.1 hypothetical protein [Novosphingobium album (ex Hu et al. 2023)]
MARSGLGQVDYNLLAQLALGGFSATPEADIAKLLRSHQPIEPRTRALLADVLEGKSKKLALKASEKAYGKVVRAFKLRRDRLKIGRDVSQRVDQIGYVDAIEYGTELYLLGRKTVERAVTLARNVANWIEKVKEEAGEFSCIDEFTLEVVYLYADATKREPQDCLRQSSSSLAELIREFDEFEAPAHHKILK